MSGNDFFSNDVKLVINSNLVGIAAPKDHYDLITCTKSSIKFYNVDWTAGAPTDLLE